jgi:hypothetical protein
MNHIIASRTDAPEVFVPIRDILSHELRDDGENREGIQWKSRSSQQEAGFDIDIVGWRSCGFWGSHGVGGEVWERCVCSIKGESAWAVDGYIYLESLVEVWSKLELAVLVSVKVVSSFWDVDPQAALSADGACTFNGETQAVRRIGRCWETDVAARDIWTAIVVQR